MLCLFYAISVGTTPYDSSTPHAICAFSPNEATITPPETKTPAPKYHADIGGSYPLRGKH